MVAIMPIFYSEKAVKLVRSLPHVLGLERLMAPLQPSQQLAYRPYTQTALDGLFKLRKSIFFLLELLSFMLTPFQCVL